MSSRSDRLAEYQRRRDFERTDEPEGRGRGPGGDGLAFAVQKHAARRLHFDLRLEWQGVLLSWAVTRGPSAAPSAKRLAVRTEDHPIDYADYEGTIPEGSYGAGTVMLWDRGTWQPLADVDEGLRKGILKFEIFGQRMKGAWTLVKMKPKGKEKRENWLLIKERDSHRETQEDGLVERFTNSVSSGRSMPEIARGAAARRRRGRSAPGTAFSLPAPDFLAPQLATAVEVPPAGDDWLHELKFDGYRCLAALGSDGIVLYTRNGHDWTDRYANLPRALQEVRCANALIDGEVIAGTSSGGSAFSALQRDLEARLPVRFCAFDLLHLDGEDLTGLALAERKRRLAALLEPLEDRGAIVYTDHVTGKGKAVFDAAIAGGAEGIIAKQADGDYRSGRSRSWLKIKAARREEFVVGGYSPSSSRGRPFASLLIGQYESGRLRYKGRVGSGFAERDFAELRTAIRSLSAASSPFDDVPAQVRRAARWLEPALVVEVKYAELTRDGQVRHGVFQGVRTDKDAEQVAPEKQEPDRAAPKVAGVTISSSDRVVFPGAGISKLQVAEYYARVADRMLEVAANRPVSLVRAPRGLGGDTFFQRHAGSGFPDAIRSVDIEESSGDIEPYIYISSPEALVSAAQMGAIEFHIWGSRVDAIEKPDRMVFDLDPDEALGFDAVRDAAFEVRDLLHDLGIECAPLLTGGKGIHVVSRLRRTAGWETVKLFTQTVATHLARKRPDRYVANMSKARRRGRIFIDWLRNERASTAIAPFSLRARPGAPVAMPVSWEALANVTSAGSFALVDVRPERAAPGETALALASLGRGVIEKLEAVASAD